MNQRHKHADVIIAWVEGKDVQIWDEGTKRWHDIVGKFPLFNEDREHRIKPPAKKYRVALFKNDTSTSTSTYTYTNTADIQEDADFFEAATGFIRWLTDWIEYEE